jgi:class 3 adenylate cyclase
MAEELTVSNEKSERINRLRRFLAPQVAELVEQSDERMLEGQRREVVTIFADLRDFTAFSARAAPDVIMGIAMGPAIVGTVGYEGRIDYTAIGSVVNLASRLCGSANDGQILVDAVVAEGVKDSIAIEFLGVRVIKGYDHPLQIFAVARCDLRQSRKAGRPVGVAADEVRASGQPQDSEGAGP